MNFQELRVGNLIFNHKEEIICVNGLGIDGYILLDKEHNISDIMCNPISLDEEWHNKFGTLKNGFDSFEYELPRKNNINVSIVFNGDYVMLKQCDINTPLRDTDIVSLWNKDLTKRDMFVHEFQNLYFSLTGVELELSSNVA